MTPAEQGKAGKTQPPQVVKNRDAALQDRKGLLAGQALARANQAEQEPSLAESSLTAQELEWSALVPLQDSFDRSKYASIA